MTVPHLRIGETLAVMALVTASPGAAATRWQKIDAVSGFQGWRAQLQHMVDREGMSRANHFCAVVATGRTAAPENSYTWVYVYWREAARLYTFGQSNEPMSDLSIFKAPLDLKKDVVTSQRDVHASTFLVTRSWLRNVLSHCARAGTEISIRRSA